MKKIKAQKILPGIVAIAAGYTTNTKPGPSVATSWIGRPAEYAMYPKTENMTKPAMKLVAELITLVKIASLRQKVKVNYFLVRISELVKSLLIDIIMIFVVRSVS